MKPCLRWCLLTGVVVWTQWAFATDYYPNLNKVQQAAIKLASPGFVTRDLAVLDEVNRAEVRELLLEVARGKQIGIGTAGVTPYLARVALLRMGDVPVMEGLTRQYREYKNRYQQEDLPREFEMSAQPQLIPYLIADAYSDEPIENTIHGDGSDGIITSPLSIQSIDTIGYIIERSDAFGPEMKAWRKEIPRMRPDPITFRRSMRRWWEENKERFHDHDYASIRPPTPTPAPVAPVAPTVVAATTPPPAPVPTPATPTPTAALVAVAEAPPPVEPAPSLPPPTARRPPPAWPWVLGAATLAVSAAWLLVRGRRRRASP